MMQELSQVLQLEGLSAEEQDEMYTIIGNEVLDNTLLRYLALLNEWEQSSFEQWMTTHANHPNLMSELLLLYPDFGKIFSEEIILLSQQTKN